MFDEHRFGNDGTEASRPCYPDHGDDRMNEKDDDIAHPGTVSKPERAPDFGLIQLPFLVSGHCLIKATDKKSSVPSIRAILFDSDLPFQARSE